MEKFIPVFFFDKFPQDTLETFLDEYLEELQEDSLKQILQESLEKSQNDSLEIIRRSMEENLWIGE